MKYKLESSHRRQCVKLDIVEIVRVFRISSISSTIFQVWILKINIDWYIDTIIEMTVSITCFREISKSRVVLLAP